LLQEIFVLRQRLLLILDGRAFFFAR